MSNEVPAREGILSSVKSVDFSKPFFLSRTFWVNVIALLSLLFPAVREWADAEPEAPVIILAFVNLVLRTVTSRAVKFSVHGNSDDGGASGGSMILPLALFVFCAACLLPSCGATGYPLTGSLFWQADDGAKVGIVYRGK